MTHPRRIVLLAMDAGDKHLLREWAADGTLPALRALFSRGLVGDTTSVDGLYEGSTWPCFYTGVNPARHGFHRMIQLRPGTYEFDRCSPGEFINQEPFWNHLSRAGKKVAILDVPLSGISKDVNGIQTVEWGSHDAVYGFRAWPQELEADVIGRFGRHPAGECCDSPGRSVKDFRRFRDELIAGVSKKCELTLHYLEQDDWDFFVQVFTEGHCAGHQCWHLHDPAHPNYRRHTVAGTGDPIRETYVAIDRAIGEILAQVDQDSYVFFLATHGMKDSVGKGFMLEEILERLGLVRRPPGAGHLEPMSRRLFRTGARGWSRLPKPVQRSLRPVVSPMLGWARDPETTGPRRLSDRLDLAKCACFPQDNGDLISGIRVNLAGREPQGIIEPGAEFDDLCRRLSEDLLAVTEAAGGRPLVKKVMKTSDLYRGERLEHLPDLLVEWNQEVSMGSKAVSSDVSYRVRAASGKIGMVEGEYRYCRTGDHRPYGLFAVVGPGLEPGTVARTVSVMDFAATFLEWFGLSCDELDGRPIGEVLSGS